MKTILLIGMICCATAALAQTNFIAISNIGQPTGGDYSGINQNASEAFPFTTSNESSVLVNVALMMGTADNPITQSFSLSIYGNASGVPGSSLATLSGPAFPTNSGIYTFTNTSSLVLAANTSYWIVAASSNVDAGDYRLDGTPSSTLNPGSIWTSGHNFYNLEHGAGWQEDGTLYIEFSVTVTVPTPPTLSLFQPITLTYTNSGFPFILQQNTNLAGTNWVTTTNAIQLSTVSTNEIVFIVPPTGTQMFYRLALQ